MLGDFVRKVLPQPPKVHSKLQRMLRFEIGVVVSEQRVGHVFLMLSSDSSQDLALLHRRLSWCSKLVQLFLRRGT